MKPPGFRIAPLGTLLVVAVQFVGGFLAKRGEEGAGKPPFSPSGTT